MAQITAIWTQPPDPAPGERTWVIVQVEHEGRVVLLDHPDDPKGEVFDRETLTDAPPELAELWHEGFARQRRKQPDADYRQPIRP